ncbi:MAG: hypothetical protein HQL17_05500 [Candidatus Omnitrophica bacterium]|nr:hypothetical protein [Candidatus Omnitrophota bacterium]
MKKYVWIIFVLISLPVLAEQPPVAVPVQIPGTGHKSPRTVSAADQPRMFYFDHIVWGKGLSVDTVFSMGKVAARYKRRFLTLEQVDAMCAQMKQLQSQDQSARAHFSCGIQEAVLRVNADL